MNHSFVLAGQILYTPTPDALCVLENGFLVVEDRKIAGAFSALPEQYASLPVTNYGDCLIVPGLCDIHVHAPQYAFRGLGMDLQLLEWLNSHAFPEEARYADLAYAEKAYSQFAEALGRSATTRASVFATLHVPAALLLTEKLEQAGVRGYAGKVNMDRNAPDDLREQSAAFSLEQTEEWLRQAARFQRVKPILTPRFIPSCTDELMDGLAALRRRERLPLQSHLSENHSEIAWVRELCPNANSYGDAYALHGLLDAGANTVMAHCIHSTPEEAALLKERDVLVAHCPNSNMNLSSGIAPIRRYLDMGIRVGLGSDVAGGFELSIFRAMSDAIQVSKLLSCYDPEHPKPLTLAEAFYLGTKGGGSLFGQVGGFDKGDEADILVLDDHRLTTPKKLTLTERLERAVYLEKDVTLRAKYTAGEKIELNKQAIEEETL